MSSPAIEDIDEALLRRWPLPQPDADGDKNRRGRVLLVGGSLQVPGAALLAGTAALRAGAGKLLIGIGASLVAHVGLAMPEARVLALVEGDEGGLLPQGAQALCGFADRVDALLLGPGWVRHAADFVQALLPAFAGKPLILDAMAMHAIEALPRKGQPVLLTPHAGELAELSGEPQEDIADDPVAAALRSARRWNCIVALKGPLTVIAGPEGRLWRHRGGNAGLATSGSGDVLAGLICALAARGAPLEQAAAWSVALHARAGEALGPVGYLARELPAQVPALMQALA